MEQRPPSLILPVIAAFFGLVGIVGSAIYYGSRQITPPSDVVKLEPVVVNATSTVWDNQPRRFDEEAYVNALNEVKVILLYFTANWCPECDYGRMRLATATAAWPSDQVAVFLVDFVAPTASSTDPAASLAAEFQVTAPDTKVLLADGKVVAQSTELWTLERYEAEVAALLP